MPPEYPFVEEPSQDFYCPVTFGLLLQPYRTSCCGQHLSEFAATRIQREGKTCPLCRASEWKTELNKDVQLKVQGLPVFCPHVDRGCEWKGKLRQFDTHVTSCTRKNAPLKSTRYTNPCTKNNYRTSCCWQSSTRKNRAT